METHPVALGWKDGTARDTFLLEFLTAANHQKSQEHIRGHFRVYCKKLEEDHGEHIRIQVQSNLLPTCLQTPSPSRPQKVSHNHTRYIPVRL